MTQYTLQLDSVIDCIWDIAEIELHRNLPGYLGLRWAAGEANSRTDFGYDYNEFFNNYLKVRDREDGKPYLIPFNTDDNPGPESDSMWLQYNVAGSYGPSYRSSGRYGEVIEDVDGRGTSANWSLVENHHEVAKERLFFGNKIPAEYLGGFLLRDFAFETDNPTSETLVTAFQEVFNYDSGDEEFDLLYTTGHTDIEPDDFQEFER